jgi:hypothetical protein
VTCTQMTTSFFQIFTYSPFIIMFAPYSALHFIITMNNNSSSKSTAM